MKQMTKPQPIAQREVRVPLFRLPTSDFRLLIPLCFALLLLLSWRRWTSLIVDTGREMDLPLRLLRGELLYRDIHYLYPPLSPYFNALLYRVFGVSLEVLNVSGVLCALLIVALCYAIARRVLAEREAILATLAVTVWCIFKPEGNLIAPYAFSALHAMIFALGTLLVTLRYGEQPRWREVWLAGLLIGLAGITKQEFALTAAVTWSAGVLFVHRWQVKELLGRLLLPALLALVIATPVYAYFLGRVGWQTLIEDCHLLYTKIPASLVFYNSARTGLDNPLASVLQMLGGAAVAMGLASLIVVVAGTKQPKLRRTAVLGFFLAAAFALFVSAISHGRWDGSPLRALPLALVGLMLWHFLRRDESKPQFALFVLATYSLMALIRVVLRVPSGGAFGGYFLPTSLILIVYLTSESLPQLVGRFADNAYALKPRLQFIGLMLLSLWLGITIVVFGVRYRKTFPTLLTAPHGKLYATAATAPAAQEAIEFLIANSTPNDAVAVLPEGSSLAFLAGRRMPLRHQIFIPDFMDAQEEQRAIAMLASVKYVLLTNRPMREFGREAFGRDYYQAMGQAIADQFRLVKVCSSGQDLAIGAPQFFIKIYERK